MIPPSEIVLPLSLVVAVVVDCVLSPDFFNRRVNEETSPYSAEVAEESERGMCWHGHWKREVVERDDAIAFLCCRARV